MDAAHQLTKKRSKRGMGASEVRGFQPQFGHQYSILLFAAAIYIMVRHQNRDGKHGAKRPVSGGVRTRRNAVKGQHKNGDAKDRRRLESAWQRRPLVTGSEPIDRES